MSTSQLLQEILVVEDSPEDYETTLRALRKAGVANPIVHCEDGDEALEFLHACDRAPGQCPCLVLLDLNLPGTSGREVLSDIKAHPRLRFLPVIVLTTSTDPNDINSCYQTGASSYIHKPVDLAAFEDAIQRFADYWFAIVVLPVHRPSA